MKHEFTNNNNYGWSNVAKVDKIIIFIQRIIHIFNEIIIYIFNELVIYKFYEVFIYSTK